MQKRPANPLTKGRERHTRWVRGAARGSAGEPGGQVPRVGVVPFARGDTR